MLTDKRRTPGSLTPKQEEEAKQLYFLGYPTSQVALLVETPVWRLDRRYRAWGFKPPSQDRMPPTDPLPCLDGHKTHWIWAKTQSWRVQCDTCRQKAARASSITNKEKSEFRKMGGATEEEIDKLYDGQGYEDSPRACRPEGMKRW